MRLPSRGRVLETTGRVLTATGRQIDHERIINDGIVLESWADTGFTLGSTLRGTGTSPPTLTISGSMFPAPELYLACDSTTGGTARGQATFKWGVAGSAGAMVATGVPTAATVDLVAPAGYEGTITVAMSNDVFNTDQTWKATVSGWSDLSGNGNDLAQTTAANQMLYRAAAFNGYPCIDFETSATGRRLVSGNIGLGAHTLFVVCRADASSREAIVHASDGGANGSYVSGGVNSSINVSRSSSRSAWDNSSSTWLNDGTRRTVAMAYDGTHAGHKSYRNGAADTLVELGAPQTSDAGVAVVSGPIYLGGFSAGFMFRGLIAGVIVANRAWTQQTVQRYHEMAARRCRI